MSVQNKQEGKMDDLIITFMIVRFGTVKRVKRKNARRIYTPPQVNHFWGK